jgi:outer membrane protein assembly factor BamB
MSTMRFSRLAALALAVSVVTGGASGQPAKVWETSGFQQPESALPDLASGIIYVSNVAGGPAARDGNGFISKLTLDGKVTAEKWVTGLDSPKGLALVGGRLFVADLDQLVEIDVRTGTIAARHQAPGAKILNDVAADADGRIYVSDWPGNAIWRLADGTFEKWLESDALKGPNGLLVESDRLVVAAWGAMKEDFSTETPGNLLTVSLADKTIANLGSGKPVGNLDGLEPFDAESYLVTDWVAGKVFQISRSGEAKELLRLSQGSADLGFISSSRTAIIPLMVDGKVAAYKF